MMSDRGLQRGLYRFAGGQTMMAHFGEGAEALSFNKDHADWGLLGDALFNLRKFWDEPFERESFGEWWCDEQQRFLKRWPSHVQHLRSLFAYLDHEYLHDRHYKYVRPAPPKMRPCGGTTKG